MFCLQHLKTVLLLVKILQHVQSYEFLILFVTSKCAQILQ